MVVIYRHPLLKAWISFEIREKGTSSKKVTLRDEKKDVDKICVEVQKTSDYAGGKPTRGFSLQHKTFNIIIKIKSLLQNLN